jgi:hypothetical protein
VPIGEGQHRIAGLGEPGVLHDHDEFQLAVVHEAMDGAGVEPEQGAGQERSLAEILAEGERAVRDCHAIPDRELLGAHEPLRAKAVRRAICSKIRVEERSTPSCAPTKAGHAASDPLASDADVSPVGRSTRPPVKLWGPRHHRPL